MIFFQTWKNKEIPNFLIGFVESWEKINPTFEYHLYTDEDNDLFMKTYFPDFYPIYNHYSRPIQRADVIRYFRLYHDGGIYADLDFECLKSFDEFLKGKEEKVILGYEPFEHVQLTKEKKKKVCNALMISPPKHPFWLIVFEELLKFKDSTGVFDVVKSTGPEMLTRAVERYQGKDILITDPILFYPLIDITNYSVGNDVLRQKHEKMSIDHRFPEESLAVHYWSGTWTIAIDQVKREKIQEILHQGKMGLRSKIILFTVSNVDQIVFFAVLIVFVIILIFIIFKK